MAVSGSTEHSLDDSPGSGAKQSFEPPTLGWRQVLDILINGDMTESHGLMPWSSNYTFLVTVHRNDKSLLAVYKPSQGERPLWDFPHGTLAQREVAAYLVSQELRWGFVPPTALRDGLYGTGAVQLFIDADFNEHYFTLRDEHLEVCRRVAAFDLITNNADRKAGHFLKDAGSHIWVVDHGLTFHPDPKLRTVVWDFAGRPLPDVILEDLRRLQAMLRDPTSPLVTQLARLLSEAEIKAFRWRVSQLVRAECFPQPGPGRSIPFPLV
jgi:hypothetical protein